VGGGEWFSRVGPLSLAALFSVGGADEFVHTPTMKSISDVGDIRI